MTQPAARRAGVPAGPRSAAGPWDLSFLRVGTLVTLACTVVAVPVVGLLAGWAEALGVVLGAVVVALFFCVSGLVIAWAGKIDDSFTLPAALGTFFVKVIGFFLLLQSLPADGWPDRVATAWTVIAGALLWSGVQARWVWTRQLYYTTPPAPPVASAEETGGRRTAGVQPHDVEHPAEPSQGG